MTRMFGRQFGLIGAGVVLVTSLAFASPGLRHKVTAVAVASSMTQQDGTTTARFVVQVTNDDDAAMTNVQVVFNADFQVAVGDVAPGATATSGPQMITVDVTSSPTQSLALPVTYKFSVDGAAVETTGLLTFRRAE